jgi:hypothetical protein
MRIHADADADADADPQHWLYVNQKKIFKTSQLRNKSERQRGRMTLGKLKLAGGDHRLTQVFIRPEVFSIHMKGLKIRAQRTVEGTQGCRCGGGQ